MVFIRKEVRSLGPGWNSTLLWYAKAVRAMQAKPITDKTSWNFLAGCHGFDQAVWVAFGYIGPASPLPSAAVRARYWDQCQHQSWYFLPWHRGYLASFEWIVRDQVIKLGGPKDWALPYWNYSDSSIPNARRIPTAFATPTMPDGTPNPLFTTRRYGAGTPNILLTNATVALTAMGIVPFTSGANGVPAGFGGPATSFNHFGATNGGIESLPHNPVHVEIGQFRPGTDPNNPVNLGLMTNPDTAGLDPIFWLHHCNIDRLWTRWLRQPGRSNSLDPRWRQGPTNRGFVMPKTDGSDWPFTPLAVINTSNAPLNYRYDDQPALPGALTDAALSGDDGAPEATMEAAMTEPQKDAELIGSNEGKVEVGVGTASKVSFDKAGADKLKASFSTAALTESLRSADRVYLKLEGIKAESDAAVYRVYIEVPEGANPKDHPECLAGTVALFGVSKASDPAGPHAGSGIDQVIDITDLVSRLGLTEGALEDLTVKFVGGGKEEGLPGFTVDRISVYRHSD